MMTDICPHCKRPYREDRLGKKSHKEPVRAYVVHDYYGCDTGCCGHTLYLVDEDGREVHSFFEFDHPYLLGKHLTAEQIEEEKIAFVEGMLLSNRFRDIPIDYDACDLVDD